MKKTLFIFCLTLSNLSYADNQKSKSNQDREDLLYSLSNSYAICASNITSDSNKDRKNRQSLIQLILNNIDEDMMINKDDSDDTLAAFGVNKDVMKGMILRYYLDMNSGSAVRKENQKIAKENGWDFIKNTKEIMELKWDSNGCDAIIENIK